MMIQWLDDTINDLHDIVYLCRQDIGKLKGVGYDVSLVDLAETKHTVLRQLRAQVNGDNLEDNQKMISRDRAFTNLVQITRYIRRYGKFVFRKEPEKAARYNVTYY